MFEKIREKLTGIAKENDEEIVFNKLDEGNIELRDEVEKKEEPIEIPKSSIEGNNIELKVIKPESINEVSTIADYLLDGCTVVLNLEVLDTASTVRMLDFLNGVTYSTDGDIKNVSKSTYIITPHNVDVSDDK